MIREAANDPAVLAIRITIYRLASKAKLVEYLCAAAENGKDVTALIELRARFDEQNNIDWSERMEEAGCKIIYGFEDYKVHSKICLITRRERGAVRHITQVGTGNYNEKTAKQYTDVSLITADERIGQDAGAFFNNMALGNLSGHYSRLFVAPTSLKNNILALMDEQIAKGKDGYILLKFNSLTDIDVIAKLREASCAGVTVEMIVRGICCLLPGVPGHTENITVTSIVGRFLEHSRIYVFGRGDEEKMYISSADLMTRNTERRVEIACPIDDPAVRTRLHDILYAMQHDTVKARVLQPDGTYCKKPAVQDPICAQDLLMQQAIENARKQAAQPAPLRVSSRRSENGSLVPKQMDCRKLRFPDRLKKRGYKPLFFHLFCSFLCRLFSQLANPLIDIRRNFLERNTECNRKLAVKQFLGTFAVALIDLTDTASVPARLGVNRLDQLHKLLAVVALQRRLIMLIRHADAVADKVVLFDVRNRVDEFLCFFAGDHRTGKHRRIRRNIDGLRARYRYQSIIQLILLGLERRLAD